MRRHLTDFDQQRARMVERQLRRPRDRRRAGAGGDGGGPARAVRLRAAASAAPTPTRPCRSPSARRSPSRGSWPRSRRASSSTATSACSRSAPARATRPRSSPGWPRGGQRRALRAPGTRGRGRGSPSSGSTTSSSASATAAAALPTGRPFAAIAVHATAPAAPATLLGQLELGGRLVVPIADRRADLLTAFVRTARADRPGDRRGPRAAADRPGPFRAPGRRGGILRA